LTATDKSVYTQVADVKEEDAGTKRSINVFEATLASNMSHTLEQLNDCMLPEAKLRINEEVTKKIASKPTDSYYFNYFAVVFFLSQEDIAKNGARFTIFARRCSDNQPHRIIPLPMLCHLPLNDKDEVIHADMRMVELVCDDKGIPRIPGKPVRITSRGEVESWEKVAQRMDFSQSQEDAVLPNSYPNASPSSLAWTTELPWNDNKLRALGCLPEAFYPAAGVQSQAAPAAATRKRAASAQPPQTPSKEPAAQRKSQPQPTKGKGQRVSRRQGRRRSTVQQKKDGFNPQCTGNQPEASVNQPGCDGQNVVEQDSQLNLMGGMVLQGSEL